MSPVAMTKSGRVPSAAVPRSRRLIVVAQQAAQAVAATNSGATHRARSRRNQLVAEALVILLLAVVHHELFAYSDTTPSPKTAPVSARIQPWKLSAGRCSQRQVPC